jgi:hypothetical protein
VLQAAHGGTQCAIVPRPLTWFVQKYILRKAFDTPAQPYLPEHILWRQKEQFSDGVGYGWINSLKALAEKEVMSILNTARSSADACGRFPTLTSPLLRPRSPLIRLPRRRYLPIDLAVHEHSSSPSSGLHVSPLVCCPLPASISHRQREDLGAHLGCKQGSFWTRAGGAFASPAALRTVRNFAHLTPPISY